MKITIDIDCTPDEARRFLGLPDVDKVNQVYIDAMAKAMQGAGGIEQLQGMLKQVAPMGEFGMKMFQNLMSGGMGSGAKK